MRERLTIDGRKIFARESVTLNSMTKSELQQHYIEVFDRLQEYEVAEEEFVFCGECGQYCRNTKECNLNGMIVENNDFCSRGRRYRRDRT